jgi:hypothetical protein
VCQAGILETVQTSANGQTTISCSAFDEWYPSVANIIPATSFQVNPGDTIKITVETTGAGATKATFIFDDETTGKIYDVSLRAPRGTSLKGNSAEVVVETPELISGNQVSQPLLSDFLGSPVVFQGVSAHYKGGLAANLSSAQSIGMWADDVPGSQGSYVQEAYGGIQARSRSVTVTENDYWPGASSNSSTIAHKIALLGNYIASSFATASDNHGGTIAIAEASQNQNQLLLTHPQHA